MNTKKIIELAESYHNGNISKVKQAVKRMTKEDFICLLAEIAGEDGEPKVNKILGIGLRLSS